MSHWISDPAELRERLQQAPPRVGLDTEFVRERTWWPQLALVQLSLDDGSLLLADAQAPGIPEALAPMLADTAVLKGMHSASARNLTTPFWNPLKEKRASCGDGPFVTPLLNLHLWSSAAVQP